MTQVDGVTVPHLARVLSANRVTVEKYLSLEAVKPIGRRGRGPTYNEEEALKALRIHIKPHTHNTLPSIDPETGLTWHQKEIKEKARKLQMENDKAEKLLSEEIMLTADHFKIISAIVSRLEQVPGKVSSEQGLTPAQTLALRRALDEAREVAAKDVEEME